MPTIGGGDVSATDSTSSAAMDVWRPSGDRMTYGDAGWLGGACGIALHATIHFFSVAMPALEPLLRVFAPVENLVFAATTTAAPIARWLLLIVSLGVFWALVAVGSLAVFHEVVASIRERSVSEEASPRSVPRAT